LKIIASWINTLPTNLEVILDCSINGLGAELQVIARVRACPDSWLGLCMWRRIRAPHAAPAASKDST
jgi:hypothetical protein